MGNNTKMPLNWELELFQIALPKLSPKTNRPQAIESVTVSEPVQLPLPESVTDEKVQKCMSK